MAGEAWTDRQLKAIEIRGSDVLVAAAAGSGKTAVLTERILRMITEENIDIDKLLVLTFTSSAASEMRDRISQAIMKKLEEDLSNERLQKQLILINRADITTIHAFCMRIVKNNFAAAGIDPNFRIINESESSILKAEVLENIFETLYESEDNEWFLNLVESFGSAIDDIELRQLILELYKFAYAGPFPEKWLDESAEKYSLSENTDFDDTVWARYIKAEIPDRVKYMKNCMREMEILLNMEGAPDLYNKVIDSDKAIIEGLGALTAGRYDEIVDFLHTVQFVTLPKKNKGSDDEIANRFQDLRKIIKKEISGLKEGYFSVKSERIKESLSKIYPMVTNLCNLTKIFMKYYMVVKKERRAAEFTDVEHMCLKVLMDENGGPSKTARELSDKYEEILTDEYQDTNLIQEYILSLVSKKNSGVYNRFMVGDIKQSIYRFRLASPEIFIDKYNKFSDSGDRVKIDLYSNFRSRQQILDSINYMFFRLMTKDFGEIDYDENAALHMGNPYEDYNGNGIFGGNTEMNIVYGEERVSEENAENTEDDEEDLTLLQCEARLVARRIKKLIDDRFEVYDNKIKSYRRMKLGDVVILMRSVSGTAGIFAKELLNEGLDSYIQKSESFFDSTEIVTIMEFLRAVDNPYQDLPILAVLKSPVYRLDGNSLFEIAVEGEGDCFYEKILNFSETEKGSYLKKFVSDIAVWKEASKFMASDMLLWKIYRDTGYFDYAGAGRNGNIRQGKLKKLIEMASEFEKNSFKGLFKFLKYIERIKGAGFSEEGQSLAEESDNIVRIMSIHKSKGLEFPVVFVSNLGKKFNTTDIVGKLLVHSSIGIGVPYIDAENHISYSSAARAVIKQKLIAEKMAEELRILYVAMTRAKEKLILTGYVKNIEKSAEKWGAVGGNKNEISAYSLRKCFSFMDWVMPALIVHKSADKIRNFCISEDLIDVSEDKSPWEINLFSEREFLSDYKGKIKSGAETQEADYPFDSEEARNAFFWEYPFEKDSHIPSCLSISDIKKKYIEYSGEENEETVYKSDKADKKNGEKSGLSAAEKGTVMHCVMEHLDFKKDYDLNQLETFMEKMVCDGILTQEEADSVNRNKVLNFFASDLGKRAKKSKMLFKEESFAMEFPPSEIYMGDKYGDTKEGIIVHGIIDCYFYEDDEIVLYDYKTDYVEKGREAEIADKYKVQLSVYKRAIEAATGKVVKDAYIYFFFIDKELKLSLK